MGDLKETADHLAHYGVLGMKWGVRRSQAQLDRAAGRTSRRQARKDAKAAKRKPKSGSSPSSSASSDSISAFESLTIAKTKGVSALSNQQLQELNNRLNLEQNYARLTTNPNDSVIKQGIAYVDKGLNAYEKINKIYSIKNTSLAKALIEATIKSKG